MKSALIFCALLLAGCGPSCADRGGRLVVSHYAPVYQPALKMIQFFPQYRCEVPE
jgi:hypothetical protein